MANLKSSQKDARRIVRRAARNRAVRTLLKSLAKKVQGTGTAEDFQAAITCVSAMDKAAKRGIIHKNKADRYKASVAALIFNASA
jgi:small subunit ribosomal protein S20